MNGAASAFSPAGFARGPTFCSREKKADSSLIGSYSGFSSAPPLSALIVDSSRLSGAGAASSASMLACTFAWNAVGGFHDAGGWILKMPYSYASAWTERMYSIGSANSSSVG